MRVRLEAFYRYYLNRPYVGLIVILITLLCSIWLSYKLPINSNQLDGLPQDSPAVREARRVTEMAGGSGYMIITLRMAERDAGDVYFYQALVHKQNSRDAEAQAALSQARAYYSAHRSEYQQQTGLLKTNADQLVELLGNISEISYIQHRMDLSAIQRKILFFMKTEDLATALGRLARKRDDLMERANPFYLDLGQPAYQLQLNDIISKYSQVGNKDISDDYYLSNDRKMMLIVIKPAFSLNEIQKSRALLAEIKSTVASIDLERQGIEAGYTGAYINYVETYDSIEAGLRPVLMIALVGIAGILLIFIRKPVFILALILSLIYGLVLTYGLTALLIGELNLITSMFGGILAGLGIDAGIHLIYRLRSALQSGLSFPEACIEAVSTTGKAAFISGAITIGAFATLLMSGFKGFSQLGLISVYGIALTTLSMFFVLPLLLVLAQRHFPALFQNMTDRKTTLLKKGKRHNKGPFWRRSVWWVRLFQHPGFTRTVMLLSFIITGLSVYLAINLEWNRDVRRFLDQSLPSEQLAIEMKMRYNIAGSPLVIATHNIDETRALYEYLEPLTPELSKYIVQTVSLYSFIPPHYQQAVNYDLIQRFYHESADIRAQMLPERYRAYWPVYEMVVRQTPFRYSDLPASIRMQFESVPNSRTKGYLTYLYVDPERMYYQENLEELRQLIEELSVPVISRHSLRDMALYLPVWERYVGSVSGRRAGGGQEIQGFDFSEHEINGILQMANDASGDQLRAMGLSELAVSSIRTHRPFRTIADLQADRIDLRTTGSIMIVAEFMRLVTKEARYVLILTALLVLIILVLSFRNVYACLLALLPFLCGCSIMLGGLVLMDVQLNYFNIVVLPIVFGYGINNAIFLFYRFLESGRISKAVMQTGLAGVASSLTTMAGWAGVVLSDHPGLRSMGLVALPGLFAVMLATTVTLPALLSYTQQHVPLILKNIRSRLHRGRLSDKRSRHFLLYAD